MKINSINSYGVQNNQNLRTKNPAFNGIVLPNEYKIRLHESVLPATEQKVNALAKKRININLICKNLPLNRQLVLEQYLAEIPKEELTNFTVNVDRHTRSIDDCYDFLSSWQDYIKPFVNISFKLPKPNPDGSLSYEKRILEFSNQEIKSDLFARGSEETDQINKVKAGKQLEEQRPDLQKKMEDSVGFIFSNDGYFPIPTEKVYDCIAKVISDDLKDFAKYQRNEAKRHNKK